MREDGNRVVAGRDKDIINRGGENISAEEVENFAYRHAGVELAAAVAMPDPVVGERVCLYVVAKPGATVATEEQPGQAQERPAAAGDGRGLAEGVGE